MATEIVLSQNSQVNLKMAKKRLNKKDYEFMHSLSSAMLEVAPIRLRAVLFFWLISIFAFFVWAYFAQIDEIARGSGKVIPSGQNQIIQNFEGGIVEEILVKEGELVKKGEPLVKISNIKSQSSLETNRIKTDSLKAKIIRLRAQATGKKFTLSKELREKMPKFIANEESLYETNMNELNSKIATLKEKLKQKKQELLEAKTHISHLKDSYEMIIQEVKMTEPMVKKGIKSKIDFLKLKREANGIEERYLTTKKSIPRLKSAIKEAKNAINSTKLLFQSDSKTKLNDALTQYQAIKANSTSLKDQIVRTLIKSPMKGIVKNLFIHTIGGVIKPGEDIMEIVPSEEKLLVEVKIKPSDIAFIYYNQKAIVKFSAYNFSIYGGLNGKVVLISPDTIKDKKGRTFYMVRIQTDKNYISYKGKKLKIIPGMTTTVNIITGKKTILDYILKPILKTKENMFAER
jgi:adhesin transport system membrane fusion protein